MLGSTERSIPKYNVFHEKAFVSLWMLWEDSIVLLRIGWMYSLYSEKLIPTTTGASQSASTSGSFLMEECVQ